MRRATTLICAAMLAAAALALIPATLDAGMILGGDLVVYRVGAGSGSLVNTGNPVFVDEYSTSGGLIQSISLPSSGSGAKLIASGTATSEGFLTVSPNGQFVALTGYNSDTTGSTSLPGTAAATVNRSVAVIPVGTGIPGITSLSDYADKNNPRSAVTTDGNSIWITGAAGGVRYATAGSSTSTQLVPTAPQTLTNFRQVNIFAGQLYASTNNNNSGANSVPLGTVGTGTPTTAGQTFTGLPGLPNVTGGGASSSEFSYFFADLDGSPGVDTLYVADDGSNATFAGLDKFSLISGVWTSNGKIGASTDAYRGLAGFVGSDGTVHLFATRRGGSGATGGGELVAINDASGFNGAFSGAPTLLATAATNEAFRGVAYVPIVVPEPATVWLSLVGGGLGCAIVRRRRAQRT